MFSRLVCVLSSAFLASREPLLNVQTLGDRVDQSLDGQRSQTRLLAFFSLLALLLSSIGIYGVMAYSVAQRTNEIGIRMALGAGQSNIFRLVVGQAMTLVAISVVIGVVGAFAATRLLNWRTSRTIRPAHMVGA